MYTPDGGGDAEIERVPINNSNVAKVGEMYTEMLMNTMPSIQKRQELVQF